MTQKEQIALMKEQIAHLTALLEGKKTETKSVENPKIRVIQYSEKSVAIVGNTKELKEQLRENGGRFNSHLKVEGEKVAGWIFSNKNWETSSKKFKKYLS